MEPPLSFGPVVAMGASASVSDKYAPTTGEEAPAAADGGVGPAVAIHERFRCYVGWPLYSVEEVVDNWRARPKGPGHTALKRGEWHELFQDVTVRTADGGGYIELPLSEFAHCVERQSSSKKAPPPPSSSSSGGKTKKGSDGGSSGSAVVTVDTMPVMVRLVLLMFWQLHLSGQGTQSVCAMSSL